MNTLRLHPGKERSLLRRHPWVFVGSVARGGGDSGETVRVEAHDGRFLAWGAFSPRSKIRVRAWSFDETERIDAAFFDSRLRRAIALRERLAIASDGVRLVHGEADGLPGLIVDRYGDTLSAQFLFLVFNAVLGKDKLSKTNAWHHFRVRRVGGVEKHLDIFKSQETLCDSLRVGRRPKRSTRLA